MNRIVIIGGGQSGGWAAHTLRAEGYAGHIALVGDEPHPPYERPPLSKAVLAGQADATTTYLFKNGAFESLGLAWHAGVRATRLDRAARRVHLSQGEPLAYDRVILATGGRARTLSVPGMDLPEVHTLRTLADARRLGPALRTARRLVVIGGGWIGLEVAATAHTLGLGVTLVEARPRLCERSLPFEASALLRALHARQGVNILLDRGVARFQRLADAPAPGVRVHLTDGTHLDGDLVVVGAGLVPHDELARDAGLVCADGVVVDAGLATSDPDIFAAGDVAVAPNPWADGALRLESWQNAQAQGVAVARAVLGLPLEPPPLPWFWSDQFGINLQCYGMPRPEHQAVMRGRPEEGSFLLFHLQQGRVMAVLGANAPRDLRLARRLIETGKTVDPAALADPDVPLSRL